MRRPSATALSGPLCAGESAGTTFSTVRVQLATRQSWRALMLSVWCPGTDLVEYLWEHQVASDRHLGVDLGVRLLLAGVLRPAKRGYGFDDSLQMFRLEVLAGEESVSETERDNVMVGRGKGQTGRDESKARVRAGSGGAARPGASGVALQTETGDSLA